MTWNAGQTLVHEMRMSFLDRVFCINKHEVCALVILPSVCPHVEEWFMHRTFALSTRSVSGFVLLPHPQEVHAMEFAMRLLTLTAHAKQTHPGPKTTYLSGCHPYP